MQNICRSERCTASYCIVLVFIGVPRTNFIQGDTLVVPETSQRL